MHSNTQRFLSDTVFMHEEYLIEKGLVVLLDYVFPISCNLWSKFLSNLLNMRYNIQETELELSH